MNYLKLAAIAAVLGLMFWLGGIRSDAKAFKANLRAERAESNAKLATDALAQAFDIIEEERAKAKAANAIAEQYEKDKRDAEAAGKRTSDELRAGSIRLRAQWQGCEARRVPASAGSASEPDAAADDRAESAGRIVRAASEADAQIRALQTFIRDAYGR